MKRIARTAVTLVTIAVVATACGGSGSEGPAAEDIPGSRDCLKKIDGMDVQLTTRKDDDPKVSEGLFATTGAPTEAGTPAKQFLMVLAAEVKRESMVEEFERDTKSLSQQLAQGGAEKLDVESGTDGTYVWVVAGAKGAAGFADAKACVER